MAGAQREGSRTPRARAHARADDQAADVDVLSVSSSPGDCSGGEEIKDGITKITHAFGGRLGVRWQSERGLSDGHREASAGGRRCGAQPEPPCRLVRAGMRGNALVRADAVAYAPERRAAAASLAAEPSARERRAQENADCIGGMRSPWKAVRKLPRVARTSAVVRGMLEDELDANPKLLEVVDLLGKDVDDSGGVRDWLVDNAQNLGKKLVEVLGGAHVSRDPRIGGVWNVDLVSAYMQAAADPERDLVGWLRFGCPAGVAKRITSSGIFPRATAKAGAAAATEEAAARVTQAEPDDNYASAIVEAELSGAEVDRLIAKGFAVWYEDWPDVLAAFGGALVSKLACIVKTRDDGTLKVRNVLDLRRSGYNDMVEVPERVVLPRLRDLVDDARALAREAGEGEECFGMVADFEDAFHTLGVDPDEWPYLLARHPVRGFVGYRTVLCGGSGCPLLWGRAAAFLGRSGQGMFDEKELRTQTYVDDPATVVLGTPVAARRRAAILLWWWSARGLQISWKKGVFGKVVKWIGAVIDLRSSVAVTITIAPSCAEAVVKIALDILEKKAVPIELVQQLAGKAGWAAGVAPVLWSQVAPLWAACAEAARLADSRPPGRQRRGSGLQRARVGTCRIRPSLQWLVALFRAKGDILTRRILVAERVGPPRVRIYADASPWGCGAFITFDGVAQEYLSDAWDQGDSNRFGLDIGDCRGQAVWESLALLVALRTWERYWRDCAFAMVVKSDSTAALPAFEKERSKSPIINAIAREMAFDLALSTYQPELIYTHVRGKNNEWADALSRLAQPGSGAAVPGPLRGCHRAVVPRRGAAWWRTS